MYCPVSIKQNNIYNARLVKQLGDSSARSASATNHDLEGFKFFLYYFCCIDKPSEHDDGSAVLIVVHDRNIECFNQFFLYFKTLWCGNIFEINTAKIGRNALHYLHDLRWILSV